MLEKSEDLYTQLRRGKFIFAGPCVLEDYNMALDIAYNLKENCQKLGLFPVFKSSYDKANRSSNKSFRGFGILKGLEWLARIREEVKINVVTDIHSPEEAKIAAQVVDILQIPAFLCRQTDLLEAAAETKKVINVKKGQFLAPNDMRQVTQKLFSAGNEQVLLTERGTSFGYNNLVVDFRSFAIMKECAVPVIFDATHSVQLPGANGLSSGGQRQFVPLLARAAVSAGVNGVFLETHPKPDEALCDGPNSLALADLPKLLADLAGLWKNVANYQLDL